VIRVFKGVVLIIAGMLLWSLLWHGFWFAMQYMPEPELTTGCGYMVTCGA